ncbi:MAG: transposase [Burkholderiaceae bacterium]
MPRRRRLSWAGVSEHVIQRGNNRQPCFFSHEDYALYSRWLRQATADHGVHVHSWVFMTNHVHLLVTPTKERAVSRMMQALGSRYVRYVNQRYKRTGTLWEGRFRSSPILSEQYFFRCQRYIELNPVRANIVETPGAYRWSSFHANARGIVTSLWTPHPSYLALAETTAGRLLAYRTLFDTPLNPGHLETIRSAVNKGRSLSDDIDD